MDFSNFPKLLSTQINDQIIQWHLQEHLVAEFADAEPESSKFSIIEIEKTAPDVSDEASSGALERKHFPVYKTDNGTVGAFSGLIYIRVTTDKSVKFMAEQFLELGFEINKTSLIPYVGWLQSRDSDFATALSGIDALAELPDIVLIEPQLLMEKQTR